MIAADELIARGIIESVTCPRCGMLHREFVNAKDNGVVRMMLSKTRRGMTFGLFIRRGRVLSAAVGTSRYNNLAADKECIFVGTYDGQSNFARVMEDVEASLAAREEMQ